MLMLSWTVHQKLEWDAYPCVGEALGEEFVGEQLGVKVTLYFVESPACFFTQHPKEVVSSAGIRILKVLQH